MPRWRSLTGRRAFALRTNVVFGQSKDKTRFQNDLGFVLSQGLTPFTLVQQIINSSRVDTNEVSL